MTVRKKTFHDAPIGQLDRHGNRWHDGWTWHITIDDCPHKDLRPVYEVAWDADGQGRVTGRRALGTASWCTDTQRVENPPQRHEPIDWDAVAEYVKARAAEDAAAAADVDVDVVRLPTRGSAGDPSPGTPSERT